MDVPMDTPTTSSFLPAGVVGGVDVGSAVQKGGAGLGVTVFGRAQQRREAVLEGVGEQTVDMSDEEEGAAVRKSWLPDRRLRAATAGVTGVGVARELAQPREEEGEKKTLS